MDIISSGARVSERGRSDYFTGTVWLDAITGGPAPQTGGDAPRLRALRVTFEPGARTAWHTHPRGQVLHILAGVGRVQAQGEAVRSVGPGDTVVIKPGERHWHGAAPGNTMTHLAMQEADDAGSTATWFEKVTDADYGAPAGV